MPHMGVRETSLNNATFVHKYGFGLGFCGMAVFLFNREHPYGTGFVCLGFFMLGAFFLSVGRVQPEKNALKYRRWFRWHAVSYSEILECGESWVYGYIRLRHYVFPWGSIYFVRANASDSLFGLDKEVISSIRSKAHI
jgi:hypothetical protein